MNAKVYWRWSGVKRQNSKERLAVKTRLDDRGKGVDCPNGARIGIREGECEKKKKGVVVV